MRTVAILSLAILSGTVIAADDLTVLKPGKGETPPRKLLHTHLLAECDKHFAKRKAEVEKLKTPADIEARQKALREKFVEALGGFPEKTPLNAKTVGTLKRDGYAIERVIYESRPEHHVTANLYLPEGKGPFPGVLMPMGHSPNGKADAAQQRAAILLAKNGMASLIYDPIGQGERSQLLDKIGNPAIKGSTSEHTMVGVAAMLVGRSTASYRIWDGIRSLDYLTSRPEIDAKKLGCTGCSGGGTLTSYLMALDDRILAAAPSCYLTSLERLFATIGPQDAEQNITGQVALGLDHADYIFLHAPKPTLILAATRDFFDIRGTWDTFREAKQVYTKLGVPERLDIIEADAGHGYPKSHREAMARFMSRWLKNDDKPITEGEITVEKDATLLCTRSGQVLDDLKGKSVFDFNAAFATELEKKRAAKKLTPEEFRKEVAKVIGANDDPPTDPNVNKGVLLQKPGLHISLKHYSVGVFPIPTARFIIPRSDLKIARTPTTLIVHELGKSEPTQVGKATETLLKSGKEALAIDLRGWGETAPAVATPGKGPVFGVEYKEAFLALHLNQPLLGQRVTDLLGIARWENALKIPVDVIGYGSAAPVVLHAAVLFDKIEAVTIDGGLVSWDNVVRTPISHNQLANVVPGALKVYDLPDLAASIAPRPLTIRNPVDAAGKPLTKEAAEEAYKSVREAYKKANAADKFKIVIEPK